MNDQEFIEFVHAQWQDLGNAQNLAERAIWITADELLERINSRMQAMHSPGADSAQYMRMVIDDANELLIYHKAVTTYRIWNR